MWVLRLHQFLTNVLNSLKAVIAALPTNDAPSVLSKLDIYACAKANRFTTSLIDHGNLDRGGRVTYVFMLFAFSSVSVSPWPHPLAVVKESLTKLTASHNCSIRVEGRKVNLKKIFPRNKLHSLLYFLYFLGVFFEPKIVTDIKFDSRWFPRGPLFPEYRLHSGRKPDRQTSKQKRISSSSFHFEESS